MTTSENWSGVPGSPGEHRTCGRRAWCLGCGEWCWEATTCPCCTSFMHEHDWPEIRRVGAWLITHKRGDFGWFSHDARFKEIATPTEVLAMLDALQ